MMFGNLVFEPWIMVDVRSGQDIPALSKVHITQILCDEIGHHI